MAPRIVTFGMFIVDTFRYEDDPDSPGSQGPLHKVKQDQIGGGGTYGKAEPPAVILFSAADVTPSGRVAAIGARMWLSPSDIGMIVDRGFDFPQHIQSSLESFNGSGQGSMWLWRDDKSRETTRAVNIYRGQHRDFAYLNAKKRLTPSDLISTPLFGATYLHFICSPERALEMIKQIHDIQTSPSPDPSFADWKPKLIYEPIPDRCLPETLDDLIRVLPSLHVFSPNHEEAARFFGIPGSGVKDRGQIEKVAERFLGLARTNGGGKDLNVVIRSGELGAFVCTAGDYSEEGRVRGRWSEAYYAYGKSDKVVDVTGAGNAFLGGLTAGLSLTSSIFEASLYGAVSSSYVIEQFGLPTLHSKVSQDGAVDETWNKGPDPTERLDDMRKRHGLGSS